MYEQNMERLKSETQLVIGMCETGVDITWQVGVTVQIQVVHCNYRFS